MSSPVTMAQVARRAGVSRTTASVVLNNHPSANIPAATRERVFAAVAELGYRPNAGARALASRRTGLFGLVTDIVGTPYAGQLIKGVQDRLHAQGKMLLIAGFDDATGMSLAVETMLEQRVEGLIYATAGHRQIDVPTAGAAGLPSVLVHCFDTAGSLPSVLPDEGRGGRSATQRLLARGHTRVAYLGLQPDAPATVGRGAGYVRALRELLIEPDEELIVSSDGTANDGYALALRLLDLADPPTAFFCGTDRVAMGAYDAIKERALRIPDDVAVVGFDNQELIAECLRPGLTTVQLPLREMGDRAATMIAGPSPLPAHTVIDCPLIERSSA